jgi:hypothetical protein
MAQCLVKLRDTSTILSVKHIKEKYYSKVRNNVFPSAKESKQMSHNNSSHYRCTSIVAKLLTLPKFIIIIIIIIIILQGIGQRPVPVQNFNFWNYEAIFWTSGGRTPCTGDQSDARPLPTQDNTTQKNADTRPCPEREATGTGHYLN